MSERRIEAFFYGLFMDTTILRASGVSPEHPRRAYVDDFALRIGSRATLIRAHGARAYGMLIALTHEELGRLYDAPGLEEYRPEAVLATRMDDRGSVAALCYNLLAEPRPDERNTQYAVRLQQALRDLKFPTDYVNSVVSPR